MTAAEATAHPSDDRGVPGEIRALEAELERAHAAWRALAEEHDRLTYQADSRFRLRRRGRRHELKAEADRALAEYGQVWRRLENARREAGLQAAVQPGPEHPSSDVHKGQISLNAASVDQLREAGMTMTEARGVLQYREEHGEFASVDELAKVPGFPAERLEEVKQRLVP